MRIAQILCLLDAPTQRLPITVPFSIPTTDLAWILKAAQIHWLSISNQMHSLMMDLASASSSDAQIQTTLNLTLWPTLRMGPA
jgi:hypothetical protein